MRRLSSGGALGLAGALVPAMAQAAEVAPQATAELEALVASLARPSVLVEAAVIAACAAVAWLIVRAVRGRSPLQGSIWFGERIVDGVLFPVLLLALAYAARQLIARGLLGEVPIALFRVAIPILISLVIIRLSVRVLHASFPTSAWAVAVERSVSWIAWGAVVLWVTGVLPLVLEAMDEIAWKLGGKPVSLRTLLEGLITVGLVLVIALWISAAIEKRLLKGTGDDLSIRKMAANLVRALLVFIGLLFALSAAGIDLTALSVLGGALGVGLGFGLQKIAANYVSGFVILAERSLRIGDMVRVDTFEGRITDIRTRYTVIRALNGREAIVPNELLITQRVENSSLADPKVLITTNVQVAYGTDVRDLKRRIEDVVRTVPRVLPDPGPACQLATFGADGMELAVLFWISDPENGQGNVRSDVNLALLDLLNREGIEIPFPQRVVHARDIVNVPRSG
jgi:small-conductance mechanosensitive channel